MGEALGLVQQRKGDVIAVAAAASYSVDLVLLERFIDRHLTPGFVDAEALPAAAWPPQRQAQSFKRAYFKWTAGADYVRDVVVPDYDWYLDGIGLRSGPAAAWSARRTTRPTQEHASIEGVRGS
jgi:hypothetical protein